MATVAHCVHPWTASACIGHASSEHLTTRYLTTSNIECSTFLFVLQVALEAIGHLATECHYREMQDGGHRNGGKNGGKNGGSGGGKNGAKTTKVGKGTAGMKREGKILIPRLNRIVEILRKGLKGKRLKLQNSGGATDSFLRRSKKDLPFCEEALWSIARLAKAVRSDLLLQHMMKEEEPLLEQMFSDGLSRALVEALKDISYSVPDILAPIQLRLMSELALILTGRRDTWDRFILASMEEEEESVSQKHEATPGKERKEEEEEEKESGLTGGGLLDTFKNVFGKLLSTGNDEYDSESGGGGSRVDSVPVPQLTLALETLGTFDLSNLRRHLLPFVASPRGGVLRLLDQHDDADIRRRAALTCAKVLLMAANEEGAQKGGRRRTSTSNNGGSRGSRRNDSTMMHSVMHSGMSFGSGHGSEGRQPAQNGPKGPNGSNGPNGQNGRHTTNGHSSMYRLDMHDDGRKASQRTQRTMLVRAQQAMVITERLVVAAISDPDPRLRATVLSTFAKDRRYDAYLHPNIHNNDYQRRLSDLLGLGSLDNLRSLFVALNDESLAARRAAISILGRLAQREVTSQDMYERSESIVWPQLRATLTKLLVALETTAARLLHDTTSNNSGGGGGSGSGNGSIGNGGGVGHTVRIPIVHDEKQSRRSTRRSTRRSARSTRSNSRSTQLADVRSKASLGLRHPALPA